MSIKFRNRDRDIPYICITEHPLWPNIWVAYLVVRDKKLRLVSDRDEECWIDKDDAFTVAADWANILGYSIYID